jgi:hypothetical protein
VAPGELDECVRVADHRPTDDLCVGLVHRLPPDHSYLAIACFGGMCSPTLGHETRPDDVSQEGDQGFCRPESIARSALMPRGVRKLHAWHNRPKFSLRLCLGNPMVKWKGYEVQDLLPWTSEG